MPAVTRVMIVDDDPTVRLTLRRALAAESDMELVAEAHEGLGAGSIITEACPDVVIMDVAMPGLSGIDVVRQMRADGDATPVLLFTGDPAAHHAARGIEHTRVLVKAGGGLQDVIDAVRQLAEPATAASTSSA